MGIELIWLAEGRVGSEEGRVEEGQRVKAELSGLAFLILLRTQSIC